MDGHGHGDGRLKRSGTVGTNGHGTVTFSAKNESFAVIPCLKCWIWSKTDKMGIILKNNLSLLPFLNQCKSVK
jgi:hypothetical protein